MVTVVHYNLVDEPWIPALDQNRKLIEISLMQAFQEAAVLREIKDPSPCLEFGMYRLMIAIVMDAYEIETLTDIREILENKSFDETIQEYLEEWKDRFDLFDETHPFYQGQFTEELKKIKKKKLKAVANLFPQLPSATNKIFFNHTFEKEHQISAKMCARGLCSLPVFTCSGGAGFSPSINGAPPVYVLIQGETLFETIMLNCCAIPQEFHNHQDRILFPPWRREDNLEIRKTMDVGSYVHGLTWLPRYSILFPEDTKGIGSFGKKDATQEIMVREIIYEPSWKFTGNWMDPNVAYKKSKDGTYPLRYNIEKELWRDFGAFMFLKFSSYESPKSKITFERPAVVSQLLELIKEEEVSNEEKLIVQLYTLESDKAKFKNWVRDSLSLPYNLLFKSFSGTYIQNAINVGEDIRYQLDSAIKAIYPRKGEKVKAPFETIRKQAVHQFWYKLKRPFEQDFLGYLSAHISERTVDEESQKIWAAIVKNTATEIFTQVVRSMNTSGDIIKRVVDAENAFNYRSNNILKIYQGLLKPEDLIAKKKKKSTKKTSSSNKSDKSNKSGKSSKKVSKNSSETPSTQKSLL